MTIHMIRSDKVYCDLLKMPMAERRPYFKEQVLAPFKPKFYKQGIPYEAKQVGGFDIMMLLSWMHLMICLCFSLDISRGITVFRRSS